MRRCAAWPRPGNRCPAHFLRILVVICKNAGTVECMTAARTLSGGDLAEVVAELYSAVHAPEDDMAVAVLRAAGRADGVAVSYSEAAKRLRVSVPTVDAWVQRGVLERVADAAVRSVSAKSLGKALSALRQLDDLKPTQRQLMRLAEDLRNRDLLAATLQAEATGQVSRVGPSVVTDEDLDAL